MTVRKHLYLITEHEEDSRVGGVSFSDERLTHPTKNKEGDITVLDKDKEGFRTIGKQVCLGYHDFESQEAYEDEDTVVAVMKTKLNEIDRHYLEKARVEYVVDDDE